MKNKLLASLAISATLTSPLFAETKTSDTVVVSASRFETSINTAPVNITVISAEDIKQNNVSSISEALESLGGIHISNLYGSATSKSSIDMGGYGAASSHNSLVLLNGRRLNDIDLSGVNLASISLSSVEKIEIIHGTSSVLYGDNAVSGVINIVTKNGQTASGVNTRITMGSFNTQTLGIDASSKFANSALFISAEGTRSDGYRDNSAITDANFLADYNIQTAKGIYGVRLNVSDESLELPGYLSETNYNNDPSQSTATIEFSDQHRKTLETYFDSGIFAAELASRNKTQTSFVFGPVSAELNTLSFTPRFNYQVGQHQFVAGIDMYKSNLETMADFGAPFINSSNIDRDSLAFYISDTYSLDKNTRLQFGVRKQNVDLDVKNTNLSTSTVTTDNQDDSLSAWDISIQHDYSSNFSLHARLAKSFRFPVLDEMWSYFYGTISLLDPQTGQHIEVGSKYRISDTSSINIDAFQIDNENEIGFNAGSYSNVNFDDTRHRGINIKLANKLTANWLMNMNYGYRDAMFTAGSYSGNTVPEVPEHKLTLNNHFSLGDSRSLVLDAVYTGTRHFGDDLDNIGKKMPAHTILNLSYKKEYKDWSAAVKVTNLTDKQYSDAGYYASWLTPPYTYYSLPERAFYVTFEGKF